MRPTYTPKQRLSILGLDGNIVGLGSVIRLKFHTHLPILVIPRYMKFVWKICVSVTECRNIQWFGWSLGFYARLIRWDCIRKGQDPSIDFDNKAGRKRVVLSHGRV